MAGKSNGYDWHINEWLTVERAGTALLILGGLVIVVGYFNQHGDLYLGDQIGTILGDFYANAGTDLVSIAVTVLIIDRLNRRREEQAEERREKERLIRQFGSSINSEAKRAAEELRAHGWLSDGTLRHTSLVNANLEETDLSGADLRNSSLIGARLTGANLRGAHLDMADLTGADLSHAILDEATLSGVRLNGAYLHGLKWSTRDLPGKWAKAAGLLTSLDGVGQDYSGWDLSHVNLKNADLSGADLRGANLYSANLSSANLHNANLSHANLWKARLSRASLQGARLYDASMQEASLIGADLGEAILDNANLQGANLSSANLSNALSLTEDQLMQTAALRYTLMPDGKYYDGRFNLEEDIASAYSQGIAPGDSVALAHFYSMHRRC